MTGVNHKLLSGLLMVTIIISLGSTLISLNKIGSMKDTTGMVTFEEETNNQICFDKEAISTVEDEENGRCTIYINKESIDPDFCRQI